MKAILDCVLTWAAERQQEAVRALAEIEQQTEGSYHLTEEQVAEVERRLAEPNPKFLTREEVRERFARRRG